MASLSRIPGWRARYAFEQAGWQYIRHRGENMLLTSRGRRTLAIPNYDELPTFVLRWLLMRTDMRPDKFVSLTTT